MSGRHADCAYLIDRAVKNPASAEDFARAALDAVRIALRPCYAAIVCRGGGASFRCGDAALAADVDAVAAILAKAPLSLLSRPASICRNQAAAFGLERTMTAAALELVFPITDDAMLLGVMVLGPRADRTPYSAEDIEFCDRVGARLSLIAGRDSLSAHLSDMRSSIAETERLASVGRMAAGLAHEIRNPLVSIRTFTQLLPERHADEEFRSGFLDLTLSEIDRISTLVGEILSYARPAQATDLEADGSEVTDVADCVEKTCLLLRSHARSVGVALDFDRAEPARLAAIGEDKLRQVVINLVINGIQACGDHGRVCVRTAAEPCGKIVVEISDDGPGMAPEVAARIFEPFFTTRREGTGLGLSLVEKILQDAGASIAVATTVDRGTTFRIELPPDPALAGTRVGHEAATIAATVNERPASVTITRGPVPRHDGREPARVLREFMP